MNRRAFARLFLFAVPFALAPAAPAATTGPKTVKVDCAKGESINAALEDKSPELVVEISGTCQEDVVVLRDKTTLRGTNPAQDGIAGTGADVPFGAALRVHGVSQVGLENLTVAGGAQYAFLVQNTASARAVNCRFTGAGFYGARVTRSSAVFEDCQFTGNTLGGFQAVDAGRLSCVRCTSRDNPSPGQGAPFDADRNSFADIFESLLSGSETGAHQQSQVYIFDSTIEALAFAARHSELDLVRVTLSGGMQAFFYGQINLTQSTQTASPDGNAFFIESFLRARNSAVVGGVQFFNFANGSFVGTTVAGNLDCFNGGNAHCQDPGDVTGTSNCALCPKP